MPSFRELKPFLGLDLIDPRSSISYIHSDHAGKSHQPESAKIPPGPGSRRHVSARARGPRVWTRGASRELHHPEAADGAQTGAQCRGGQADAALHVPGGPESDPGHDPGARLHLGHAQIPRLHLGQTQTKVSRGSLQVKRNTTQKRIFPVLTENPIHHNCWFNIKPVWCVIVG